MGSNILHFFSIHLHHPKIAHFDADPNAPQTSTNMPVTYRKSYAQSGVNIPMVVSAPLPADSTVKLFKTCCVRRKPCSPAVCVASKTKQCSHDLISNTISSHHRPTCITCWHHHYARTGITRPPPFGSPPSSFMTAHSNRKIQRLVHVRIFLLSCLCLLSLSLFCWLLCLWLLLLTLFFFWIDTHLLDGSSCHVLHTPWNLLPN